MHGVVDFHRHHRWHGRLGHGRSGDGRGDDRREIDLAQQVFNWVHAIALIVGGVSGHILNQGRLGELRHRGNPGRQERHDDEDDGEARIDRGGSLVAAEKRDDREHEEDRPENKPLHPRTLIRGIQARPPPVPTSAL